MQFRHCACVATCLALLASAAMGAAKRQVTEKEVQSVHRSALLIDTHNDVTSFTVEGFDIGSTGSKHHTDLARLKAGSAGAVFFAAYVGPEYAVSRTSAVRALQMIDTIRTDIVARYSNDFTFAESADDIESARKRRRIAALIGIEGGHAIEDSLRLLRDFYGLGVRYMTLTHSNTNNWADSSGDVNKPDVKHHNGLTSFGKQVVAEMNRLGMIVDISHASDKTFWDALEISRAPIFASHSSSRAICNVARNMTDEMIVALAKKGGVIQINFYSGFLSQTSADADRLAEAAKSRNDRAPIPPASLEDVVGHINHVVKIAGIEAVGIGSDFDGVKSVPVGLEDVSKFPNLTRALLEEGYSASDIGKIYGGNTLRLMRAVERVSVDLKASGK
jgi:membrane dipeptidase